jgi:uncharacterized membrane protein (DUF106 family)
MSDIIEYIKSWSALKWVILVLIAGFIGQFGRMTAEFIVKKVTASRAKKENTAAQDESSAADKTSKQMENKAKQEKLEKKRLKAAAKAAKKTDKRK